MAIRAIHCIAVLGVYTLTACSKGANNRQDSIAAIAAESVSKSAAAATPVSPTNPPLTDANILAIFDEANMGDSVLGHLASTKATNPQVRDFGKTMMRDHHALRKLGLELAKKQNITPVAPTGDTLPASVQRTLDTLKAMPKGPDWDKAYITNEVAVHQTVLGTLQAAQSMTSDAALKSLITKSIPTIESHLKRAQELATNLSTAPTPTTAESAKTGGEAKRKR